MQIISSKALLGILVVSLVMIGLWQSKIFSKNNTAPMQNTNIAQNPGNNTKGIQPDSNSFIENLRKREFKSGEIQIE